MKIFIKVKPRAKENGIEKIDKNHFVVSVKEPPEKGKANKAILGLLAEEFQVSSTDIKIIAGHHSKNKIVEINF
jgi:hypothetical protein